jgi:hypothetical protein
MSLLLPVYTAQYLEKMPLFMPFQETRRLMLRHYLLLLLFLVPGTAAVADSPLADDLCNFPIEGLTLDSSPDDVRHVFAPRGWFDESTAPRQDYRTRKMFQEAYFRDIPSTQPLTTAPNYFFKLTITEGVGTGIMFRDADADAADRVRAACEQLTGRFQIQGCDRKRGHSNRWEILAQPFPGSLKSYCQLTVGMLESRPTTLISISIGRHQGSPALIGTGTRKVPPR